MTAEISSTAAKLPKFGEANGEADFIRDEDFLLFGRKQPFCPLDTAVDNASKFVEFSIKILGVEPQHLVVMASQQDYANIIFEFNDWVGGNNRGTRFYADAKNAAEHEWWQQDPQRLVPEDLLPVIKASYNFTGRFVGSEEYQALNRLAKPQHTSPTLAAYRHQMEALQKEAESGENILSVQFFATHRVSSDGMQGVATNTVIPNTQNFELIRVEEFLRTHAQATPNVYYLVFFAYECKADVTG